MQLRAAEALGDSAAARLQGAHRGCGKGVVRVQ